MQALKDARTLSVPHSVSQSVSMHDYYIKMYCYLLRGIYTVKIYRKIVYKAHILNLAWPTEFLSMVRQTE